MSKAKLKGSSQRFLNLLKLGIVSFIAMGILIGYHGAPLINSLIGLVWFLFAVSAGMFVITASSLQSSYDESKSRQTEKTCTFGTNAEHHRKVKCTDRTVEVSEPA